MSDNSDRLAGIDYQIGVGNVLGDDNLFKEILQMFYDDHHKDDEHIQRAITEGDTEKLKSVVHTLKGVSCSIGAMTLFEKVKQFDITVNRNESDQYQVLFDEVATEHNKVINGIKIELSI